MTTLPRAHGPPQTHRAACAPRDTPAPAGERHLRAYAMRQAAAASKWNARTPCPGQQSADAALQDQRPPEGTRRNSSTPARTRFADRPRPTLPRHGAEWCPVVFRPQRVFDVTESLKFCSGACCGASALIRAAFSTEAAYLRSAASRLVHCLSAHADPRARSWLTRARRLP